METGSRIRTSGVMTVGISTQEDWMPSPFSRHVTYINQNYVQTVCIEDTVQCMLRPRIRCRINSKHAVLFVLAECVVLSLYGYSER